MSQQVLLLTAGGECEGEGIWPGSQIVEFTSSLPRRPVGRQRTPLKPKQTHTTGLLASQNGLDDGGLQQRQAQQFVDRRVVLHLALGDSLPPPTMSDGMPC